MRLTAALIAIVTFVLLLGSKLAGESPHAQLAAVGVILIGLGATVLTLAHPTPRTADAAGLAIT